MRRFPGTVYRDGPTGRRAALAVGPDVGEVIATVRHVEGSGAEKARNTAELLSLDQRWVQVAVESFTAHPDEIDDRIAANDRAAEQARQRAERRERLLA